MTKSKAIPFFLLLLVATPIAWWLSQEQSSRQYHTFLSLESAASKPADHVKQLDLSKNNLLRFPDHLLQYKKSLTILNLDGYLSVSAQEILREIYRNYKYPSLEDSIQIANYSKQTKGNQLAYLPNTIGQFTALEVLSIKNNQLSRLPESLSQLPNLQELYLSGNKIRAIPSKIGQLSKLEKLDLSNNQLKSLPKSFEELSQLKKLNLSANKLTDFLTLKGSTLSALQQLELNHNQLEIFPYCILKMPQLNSLEMSDNQLTELPKDLSTLRQLEWFDLSNNNFPDIEQTRIKRALPQTTVVFE